MSDETRVPKEGQIIYYDGGVRHYYRVLEVNGTKAKVELLGQNPDNEAKLTFDDYDFALEEIDPTKEHYKVYTG